MYHWFSTLIFAKEFIESHNNVNENNRAKLVAWPHTQVKVSEYEFGVFVPKSL